LPLLNLLIQAAPIHLFYNVILQAMSELPHRHTIASAAAAAAAQSAPLEFCFPTAADCAHPFIAQRAFYTSSLLSVLVSFRCVLRRETLQDGDKYYGRDKEEDAGDEGRKR